MAKYRKQPVIVGVLTSSSELTNQSRESKNEMPEDEEDTSPAYDTTNLEACKAFLDAKRKLRIVLSTADFNSLPQLAVGNHGYNQGSNDKQDNELVAFLKMQLAEAINLQDKHLIAQLHETIRCLKLFDNDGLVHILFVCFFLFFVFLTFYYTTESTTPWVNNAARLHCATQLSKPVLILFIKASFSVLCSLHDF